MNFSEFRTRSDCIRTETSWSDGLRQAAVIKRNMKYLWSAGECANYSDGGRVLSVMGCQPSGWMRRTLGLGYARMHARTHWCHRGELEKSQMLQLVAAPSKPQTGRQMDRETGQQNLMSVFNLLFEVKLKKKIAIMDLNYRGYVSISV